MSVRSPSFVRREFTRRPLVWLVSVPLAFGAGAMATVLGCAQSHSSSSGSGGSYSTGNMGSGVGGGDASVDVMADTPPPPQKLDYSALCGDGCKPGNPMGCSQTGASSSSTGSSTSTGASGSGSTGASGTGTSTGSSMMSSTSSGVAPTAPGCQISAEGMMPMGVCAPTGHSGVDGPCQTAADCASGLGCIATSGAGQCRPYCCGTLEACGKGTFCTPLPMAERPGRVIPVCTPVTPCQLFTANCMTGETCTIVRADGTTSCIPKGPGGKCDACPCGDGFVCSATGFCQKLCHTTPTNECGAGSTCQGGSTKFPAGVGICVGGAADCIH